MQAFDWNPFGKENVWKNKSLRDSVRYLKVFKRESAFIRARGHVTWNVGADIERAGESERER